MVLRNSAGNMRKAEGRGAVIVSNVIMLTSSDARELRNFHVCSTAASHDLSTWFRRTKGRMTCQLCLYYRDKSRSFSRLASEPRAVPYAVGSILQHNSDLHPNVNSSSFFVFLRLHHITNFLAATMRKLIISKPWNCRIMAQPEV